MNPEEHQQPPFLHHQQSIYHSSNFKYDQNDKTTHLFSEHECQSRQTDQFIWRSPFRPFTPTSPKHFQFDITNSDNPRSAFKVPLTLVSISKRIDFQALDQEQASENQGLQQKPKDLYKKKSSIKRGIKNVKGLKNLSESVYAIVSQLGKTKYKVVAQTLIEEITRNGEYYDREKDEHNIKRRVYDALNVLIAAGMLQKQGKDVVCNQPYEKSRSLIKAQNMRQKEQKQKIFDEMKKKADLLEEKRILLQNLKSKKQNIARIIHRNMDKCFLEKSSLKFPLIGFTSENGKQETISFKENLVLFKFQERPALYGDVDLLLRRKQEAPLRQTIEAENIYNVILKQEDFEPKTRKKFNVQQRLQILQIKDFAKKEEL